MCLFFAAVDPAHRRRHRCHPVQHREDCIGVSLRVGAGISREVSARYAERIFTVMGYSRENFL